VAGAKGSALEWALALLQVPGQRYLLRQKPLPDGMEQLLAIAAGSSPEVMAQAVAAFGESEARLREAAQFYAREVLFFPEADAYRVLGVTADASWDRIKLHHRLLQSWLHPDRPHSEEDAAFAARVNAAWNQLRSPERRRVYDQTRRSGVVENARAGASQTAAIVVPAWRSVHEPLPMELRWRRRLPILALLGVCALLAVLAVRDLARDPEPWDVPAPEAQEIASVSTQAKPDGPSADVLPTSRRGKPNARASAIAPPSKLPPRAHLAPQRMRAMPVPVPAAAVAASVETKAVAVPASAVDTLRPEGQRRSAAPVIAASSTLPPSDEGAAGEPEMPAARGDAVAESAQSAVPGFDRLQAAQQAGDMLLRYMRDPDRAPPPIWNSPQVEDEADRLRQRLHARGRVRLAQAKWQIGYDSAGLESAYIISGNAPANGQLRARLRWRDGYWLVTAIALDGLP